MKSLPEEDLSDWELLLRFLPSNWEALGRETGALRRTRGFADAESLLRTLLLHLVEGRSLKETAMQVNEAGLAQVSSVAIWKRLKHAGDWFRLLNEALLRREPQFSFPTGILKGHRVRLIDGTTVCEPGRTGSTWRVHYSVELLSLRCDSVKILEKNSGETFRHFDIAPGDILVADRIYANRPGISHVVSNGGDVVVRMPYSNVPLIDAKGKPVSLLKHLRKIRIGTLGEWQWEIPSEQPDAPPIPVRICAMKRSQAATERAQSKVRRKAQKSESYTPSAEALEAAGYVFVLTTLPSQTMNAAQVLELYRGRWQIELVFKRLKSILGLGHLPKKEPDGARAWLQGKLLVATLVEILIAAGETLSPWGYPIQIQEKPVA